MMSPLLIAVITLSFILFSCNKDKSISSEITNLNDLVVDPDFTFETSRNVAIQIKMLDNSNGPVEGMRVDIYTASPDSAGKRLLSGITDSDGLFESISRVPAYLTHLSVGTKAIGFVNMQSVEITSGELKCTLGGEQLKKTKSFEEGIFKSTNYVFVPLGTYSSQGIPKYLEPVNDVIDAATLQDINATLPEYKALPSSHPQYFATANEQNLNLTEACNVWVTFVHEGAGYLNVLGFYTFDINNPPVTVADIATIHIIFPNVSFSGSGGGLASGNKVYLGQFAPGTSIGWVLLANGFQNGTITNGNWVLFSDKQLNPEPDASLKQHVILCNDIGRGKFLLSFEDIRRDKGSDNDFNDAVFYVTADPIRAVDVSNVPMPSYTSTDTDKDGVSDDFDDYPADPAKAFNNYYPGENIYGSLAFEDLWPSKGDYDFNDMVIDYNVNQITNGQNKIVEIKGKYILRAIGAGFENGFGFQIPVTPSLITRFTGYDLNQNIIKLSSNGTETNQTNATFILFDDANHILPHISGSCVNTITGDPYSMPDTLAVDIVFTTPMELGDVGTPPYNPFIFVNKVRSHEVHLINNEPTDLADLLLFGTGQDDSKPASGRYYVTKNNLPWALNTAYKFDYPAEKIPINKGFAKFIPWCVSGGTEYYDWFLDKTGYRIKTNLYN